MSVFEGLKPLTPGQEELVAALSNEKFEVVGVFGPTGTGKSLFSIAHGISSVLSGKRRRFIIARPLIDVVSGRELSVADLGDLYYSALTSYVQDLISGFVEWQKVKELLDSGKVVIADTHYLKGRTFDDSIVFLDDSESLPVESAIEILMRVGRNTRFIVAGDPVFQGGGGRNSAVLLRELLLGEESARVVDLGLKDIVRPGARRGVRLLLESRLRSRQLREPERQIMEAVRSHAPDADVISVVEFVEEKRSAGIGSESAPDALVIVKEGHLGRVIGKGGERIAGAEEDTGLRLRAVELSLDFKPMIRAVHPISWIHKHVVDADFAGPDLLVKVEKEAFGPFLGQRGAHIRFLDAVFRKLIGAGVKAMEVEARRERPKKAARKKEEKEGGEQEQG
ncbi:MAG: PhoH family protein [Desulfurococcaceae archaeon]